MQAGSVNASVLLASFLGSEHEKIGQEISRSDFAGELEKYRAPTKREATEAESVEDRPSRDQQGSTTLSKRRQAQVESEDSVDDTSKTKSARTRSSRAAESRARIKDLKATAENGENLFITNPLLAESILSELHYPSETIKACKNLQNKDGWISIADFKALLAKQATTSSSQQSQAQPGSQAQISTAQVQALLGTIVQKLGKDATSSTGTAKAARVQTTPPASSQTSGNCTIADLRAMIDQVLQQADAESTADKSLARTPIAPSSAAAAQEAQITGDVMMTPKQGQTESVTAATVPSFVSDDLTNEGKKGVDETTAEIQARIKAAAQQSEIPVSEASGKNRVTMPEDGVNKTNPNETRSASQMKTAEWNLGTPATGSGTDSPDLSQASNSQGQKTASDTGLSPAAQDGLVQDVTSLAESFRARIVSSGSDDSLAVTSRPVAYMGSLEESTLRNLDISPAGNTGTGENAARLSVEEAPPLDVQGLARANGREVDKTTPTDGDGTGTVEQVLTELTEDGQPLDAIKTPAAEGETDQQFPGNGQKRADEQLQSYRNQMRTSASENGDLDRSALTAKDTTHSPDKALARDGASTTTASAPPNGTLDGEAPYNQNPISRDARMEAGPSLVEDAAATQVHAGKEGAGAPSSTSEADAASQNTNEAANGRKKTPAAAQVGTQSQTASKAEGAVSESTLEENRPFQAGSTASRMVRFPSSTKPVTASNASAEGTAGTPISDTSLPGLTQQESASNLTAQIGETQDTASQSASQGKSSINGHNAAMVAKEMETQLKYSDAAQDSAAMHGLAGGFNETKIEMPGMQQSMTDGGQTSYYDPGRSVQIVESYREHLRSIGGQQLTLEMEPGEFGKMSIRVGTRKDEVSAVIMTDSESTRQALLKNSPDLRQTMENNGLELGKFMVDVDRQNSGNQNGRQWQAAESQNTGLESKPVGTTEQIKTKPVYRSTDGRLSRVSLFA
ncbi:MAG: flagellar hook-length control protein FliK [Syntrophobacter sp.]